MKRVLSLLLTLLMLCSAGAAFAADPVPVTKITLTPNRVSLPYGKSTQLKAQIEPKNASNKALVWSSSDENVVKVKDGRLTGMGTGTATVTAAAQDGSGVFASATVSVTGFSTNR